MHGHDEVLQLLEKSIALQMETTLTSFSRLPFQISRSFVGSHHIAERGRPLERIKSSDVIKMKLPENFIKFTADRRRVGLLWTTVVCTVCSVWQLSTLDVVFV